MNPLKELEACGQAPWLDYLKRSFIEKGELEALIERDGLKGVTSNPSIFQKAMGESEEYTPGLSEFLNQGDHSISEIYERLAIQDIQAAADVLRPVYDATSKRDGYVSLECSPYVAKDTEATLKEARHLWSAVGRDNLMVKVPATPEGVPAIRALIAEGVNVNVTLLFSVESYEAVVEAYLSGLEALQRSGGDVSRVGSVASFFVSRIDTAVDKRLESAADKARADRLRGRIAIANAKVAYERYLTLFAGPRWDALAAAGAKTQRLLWASTSTKDPEFKDTLYVEALIGRDTVDTLPPATMDAFRDHGRAAPDAIQDDLEGAHALLEELSALGVSLKEVTDALVEDGVRQFSDAFDKLFASVAKHRDAVVSSRASSLDISLGSEGFQAAFNEAMEDWRAGGKVRRLWAMDATLWTGSEEAKWGGWLNAPLTGLGELAALQTFAAEVKAKGYKDILLLGMGGSSLGPEVLGATFGQTDGWPRFQILDSTDPAQIKTVEDSLDLSSTLFMVSSKSGSTLEPNIFLDYFLERVRAVVGEADAGSRFVAVTDPGSSLEAQARELGFSAIFKGLPSIGGRYSVLSNFGLAPAAAMGVDLERLLKSAVLMQYACGPDAPPAVNPGVRLGLALGLAASRFGRDKVTVFASPKIADLGAWLEQLLAESTGKQGRGLIPVAGEPVSPPSHYGEDRIFAYIALDGDEDAEQARGVSALRKAGLPVVEIAVKDEFGLAQEFFRWEVAVAVAGALIGIDPFDQPDVEASKKKTHALTDQYERTGRLADAEPLFQENGLAVYADPRNAAELGRHNTLSSYLKSHFARVGAGDYVAFLAYVERSADHIDAFTDMRVKVRDHARAATCVGFGPRFQHSTGQAYKGGPNTGVFLQVTCDDPADLEVPGRKYTFGVVKAAQAAGDLSVLVERDRRALRVHVKQVDEGLRHLAEALEAALS